MNGLEFQNRLNKIRADFDKFVFSETVTKGEWREINLKYLGDEEFDGVHNEDRDIFVKTVSKIGREVWIKMFVRGSQIGTQNKRVTMYFDPSTPFYNINDAGIINPNDRKLKTQIDIQIKCVLSFDKEMHECGDVKLGSKVDFEFNYLGQEPIIGVKGSCGCTDVHLKGNKIYGTLDTTDFKVDQFWKQVTVYFGQYERPWSSDNGILVANTKYHAITLNIHGQIIN